MKIPMKYLLIAGVVLAAVGYFYIGEQALAALLLPFFGSRRLREEDAVENAELKAKADEYKGKAAEKLAEAQQHTAAAEEKHGEAKTIPTKGPTKYASDEELLNDVNSSHRN